MTYVGMWAVAFAITSAVECVVAGSLLGSKQGSFARRALVVLLAQWVSHPTVWFILPELGMSRLLFVLVAESWAVASELGVYRVVFPAITWRRAIVVSLLANACSFLVGLLRG